MAQFHVLCVADEPDAREAIELSLGLDPGLATMGCPSGEEALAAAAKWLPELVLCDVTMPVMDGSELVARLRENPVTANMPVVFMVEHSHGQALEYFRSLGASGIIAKPFDPMTLAGSVRDQLRTAKLATMNDAFGQRLRRDAIALAEYRAALGADPMSVEVLKQLQACAHKLAGSAGIFGHAMVSSAASAVEDAAIDRAAGGGAPGAVEAYLEVLLACIANESVGAVAPASPSIVPAPGYAMEKQDLANEDLANEDLANEDLASEDLASEDLPE
jgi:CheY-like chemotaxis protein